MLVRFNRARAQRLGSSFSNTQLEHLRAPVSVGKLAAGNAQGCAAGTFGRPHDVTWKAASRARFLQPSTEVVWRPFDGLGTVDA
jgi:hypothetical protein